MDYHACPVSSQKELAIRIRIFALALLLAGSVVNAAEPMQRAPDKTVQRLIEATARDTKAFIKALPSDLKNSVIRSPTGEVNVENYLEDLSDDIKRLSQRFKPDYSASSEVTALLNRAEPLNRYLQAHPELKGANDWDVVARDLNELARSYGASFPLGPDGVVRRFSDGEIDGAAKAIATNLDKTKQAFKSDLGKAKNLKEPGAPVLTDFDDLAKALKDLRSLIDDGKPATAAARLVAQRAAAIGSFIDAHAAELPKAVPLWQAGVAGREKIAQAFGLLAVPPALPPP